MSLTASTLPPPEPTEQAHSQKLLNHLQELARQQPYGLSFQDYMRTVLYAPGLGYYVAGKHKLGQAGDFITAPEISPLFSYCLAQQCAEVLNRLEQGVILELGAGSGIMAAAILLQLEKLTALPEQYLILEVSPDLQQQQQQTLAQQAPHLLPRVQWLNTLPETQPVKGVILANEVMDALPVERFCIADNEAFIQHITWQNDQLTWQSQTPSAEQQARIEACCIDTWDVHYAGYRPAQPYYSEYCPVLPAWIKSLAGVLQQGLLLLIDYGYERADYYRPGRDQGTLLCHYRHRVHDNPLLWPGLQDITASVDFTAVALAAEAAQLALSGYTTQADFLINSGLESLFLQALERQPEQQYALAQQVRLLTLPAEMGERFKVMALTKGFTTASDDFTLAGFQKADQRHRL